MTDNRQRGTILVVDDNADIRSLAKRLLEIAGYAVISAADGEEGLRCYEKHRSSIVLLLTDVVMPNIGGFELAERVLKMDSGVSVVLMSGDSVSDYRSLEYLAKPFAPTELIETVNRVLSTKKHTHKAVAQGAY
jgi:DNA-binding NtrC family response regulator